MASRARRGYLGRQCRKRYLGAHIIGVNITWVVPAAQMSRRRAYCLKTRQLHCPQSHSADYHRTGQMASLSCWRVARPSHRTSTTAAASTVRARGRPSALLLCSCSPTSSLLMIISRPVTLFDPLYPVPTSWSPTEGLLALPVLVFSLFWLHSSGQPLYGFLPRLPVVLFVVLS